MNSKFKKDYLVGIILIGIGIFMSIMSMQIKVKAGSTDPGSRLFPLIACGLLIICGIFTIVLGRNSVNKRFVDQKGFKRIILFFVIMIFYTLGLKYIGFNLSTPFFLFVMTGLLSGGKKTSILGRIIYSIVITAMCWFVFGKMFKMVLPSGMIF